MLMAAVQSNFQIVLTTLWGPRLELTFEKSRCDNRF